MAAQPKAVNGDKKRKPETQAAEARRKQRAAEARARAKARALAAEEKAKELAKTGVGKQIAGFMEFVRKQGIVGLAVGLAIGTQAGATVKAIVEGFINPIVAFIVGSQTNLLEAKWDIVGVDTDTVNYWFTLGERTLVISWGAILSSIITLLAVAAVIYYVVKGLKLDKLDKPKD